LHAARDSAFPEQHAEDPSNTGSGDRPVRNHKHYREIFVDGRPLPVDPNPSWFGYSTGRWEADVFIVESVGFNDKTWLDYFGHQHSESLRVIERYSRTDFGHMDVQVTIDDPGTYTRPFTVTYPLALSPDTEMIETICEDNGQILARLVGTDLAHPPPEEPSPWIPSYSSAIAGLTNLRSAAISWSRRGVIG
jgi:hypothetical protein